MRASPSQVTRPQEEIDEEVKKGNKRPKKYKDVTLHRVCVE